MSRAKRRTAEGVGSGEGRCSPSSVWGSGGIFDKSALKVHIFLRFFFHHQAASFIQILQPLRCMSLVCNASVATAGIITPVERQSSVWNSGAH